MRFNFDFILGSVEIFFDVRLGEPDPFAPWLTYKTDKSSLLDCFMAKMNGATVYEIDGIYYYDFITPEQLEHFHFIMRRPAFE